MSTTSTQPTAGQYLKGFYDFALDYGRHKLIDVERQSDTENKPDYTDVRTGNVGDPVSGNNGYNMNQLLLMGGAVAGVVALVFVVKKVL